ncbi:hypothetical protein [Thiothrix nivea]|uniref:hypothetical protein n=1 Tax=Thiothrix nivea TaxID=1031 RepID=UPI001FDF7ECE|nr:hypothetical protein [Thiothrix nivea]
MPPEPQTANPILSESQIADLKLAASKMSGSTRRAFQADMSRKYCAGNARQTERCFGWGREGVQLGLGGTAQRHGLRGCAGGVLWPEALGGNPAGSGSRLAGAGGST